MKVFQIEEPDGGPPDPGAPGAAIGIDVCGAEAEVAFSVGGNAIVLGDREGFERALPVPQDAAATAEWRELFEGARIRAERALARPVSHAVIVVPASADRDACNRLRETAEAVGLQVLRLSRNSEPSSGANAALGAAVLAEDLAPPPD